MAVASSTAFVSPSALPARAHMSVATRSMAGRIRPTSASVSAGGGPVGGSVTGSGIRTTGPTAVPGLTP